jgi:hypothetical protein
MKNDSKIAAKKALPGSIKAGASFTKRSGGPQKNPGKTHIEEYGPASVSNIGSTVSDDNAGTRSRSQLPPECTAMKAPAADMPAVASDLAAATLAVPDCDAPLFTVEPFDYARDRKLGRLGS